MSHHIHGSVSRIRHSRRLIALLLISLGLVVLVSSSGIVDAAVWNVLWPLALIGVGFDLVTEGRQRRRVIAGTLLGALVCVPVVGMATLLGREQTAWQIEEGATVPPIDGLERLQANIMLTSGQLSIRDMSDSDDELVDVGRDGLISSYTREGGIGTLDISGKSWTEQDLALRFPQDLPLDLTIVAVAANASPLDFEDLRLERLNLNVGTGDARITLPDEGRIDATITSAFGGKVEIQIPDDLPARIEVDASLSSVDIDERFRKDGDAYVSEDYSADDENHALVRIEGTAGNVKIR
jgi:hypothetical protein